MIRPALRDDRGDVPAWPIVVMTLLVVLLIVVTKAILQGLSFPQALLLLVEGVGALVAVAVLSIAAAAISEKVQAHRRRDLEWRMGPVLREWMGTERLGEPELTWWRRCERRGVTVQLARRWADDGLAYPLLLASPRLDVDQRSVRKLANVMLEAGAWDGRDRRRLVDLIGFHVDFPGGWKSPVLGRWLALPLETVRHRVAEAVTHADIDQHFIVPDYRATAAAEAALYDMEREFGIKGHRVRPQRPVHPSWLVHAG